MPTLSPSLLNDADVCLKRLEFKRQPQPYMTSEARAVGNGYHAGLEAFYSKAATDPVAVLAVAALAFSKEVREAGTNFKWETTAGESIARIDDMLTAYFDGGHFWPSTYKVLATEWEYNHPVPGGGSEADGDWYEHGFVDLLLEDPNGWLVIVDHKTAGKMWSDSKADARKINQSPLYTAAVQKEWATEKTLFAYDVMTYAGKFKRFMSEVKPANIAAVRAKQLIIGEMFYSERSLPANPSSNLCSVKFCDFWDVCPYGAALAG